MALQRTHLDTRCFPARLPAPPAHLLVWVHVDVALDALLPHVGPGVPAHPFSFALGTLVLTKAALFALVRGQTLSFGACLENRKQTQGVRVHKAKTLPSRSSSSAFITYVPMHRCLLSPIQRTPGSPQSTHGNPRLGDSHGGQRKEEVVGVLIFFRFKGANGLMVARNYFFNSDIIKRRLVVTWTYTQVLFGARGGVVRTVTKEATQALYTLVHMQ